MSTENIPHDEKTTLWTCQSRTVIDTIIESGVYHVKKEYIHNKYKEVSCIFLEAYNWFVFNAENNSLK